MLLLEQNTIMKKKIEDTKLKLVASNTKKYKVETIYYKQYSLYQKV